MEIHEELFALASKLTEAGALSETPEFRKPVEALEKAARQVGESFSGSWLGYHALVYYAGFQVPPPGAHFSQEWGLGERISYGTVGDWRQYRSQTVLDYIDEQAGQPDLSTPRKLAAKADTLFKSAKSDFLSIVEGELGERQDRFLEKLKGEIEGLELHSASDVVDHLTPKGQIMTRDSLALSQGMQMPPHVAPIADVMSLNHSMGMCRPAGEKIAKVASHIERQSRRKRGADRVGTNVFIGHGQSPMWRELKDFIGDRLSLPWDEFNRVPVAGVTNTARLLEMLDAASIAFLVMTAEDELADGGIQARMNVIHEAGLFQGRLGFTKAIILLEEGCAEFSNIQGLGQIRFPAGKIAACFEEVRRVLEREGLIEAPAQPSFRMAART